MAGLCADVRETHKLIINHVASIRTIPGLEDATIVFVLESNLAFESQHIIHALNEGKVKKWLALSEGASGGVGWLTTHERKESMCFQLRESLNIGNIGLSKHFVSNSLGKQEMLQVISEEMRNFCILVEPPKTAFGKVKKTYSGKIGGRNDDVIITMQLAIAGMRVFYQSEKYNKFRLC